jgi:hypothetical protein
MTMVKVPQKISDRIVSGIKRFQPVLTAAKSRDVGESDTVTIITDILADVFGYDKYSEITSEHAIRGTFVDLAIKVDGVLQMLIEAKAIGIALKEQHVKQAIDYAANQGIDWVVLTNGIEWRVYKVTFSKPIDQELVFHFDFCTLNHRDSKDIESVYLLCKEGWVKSVLGEFHTQKQALSRFFLSALIQSETILQVLRRELKRISPDVRVETDEILSVLTNEVIKREVLEGDQVKEAIKKINKTASRTLRATKAKDAPVDCSEHSSPSEHSILETSAPDEQYPSP